MQKRSRDPERSIPPGGESIEPGPRIRLLGPWEVQLQGQPLRPLRSRKGQWLLALLVLQKGRSVARDWLAGTLWPDSSESQGLYNLRRNLTDLRDALGPEAHRLREPARFTLALDLAGVEVDLLDFDAAIARGDLSSLAAAVGLYHGPLLEGCSEEWIAPERTAREQAYLAALEALAADAKAREGFAEAAGFLRRAVAVDPLRESSQCALMEALAAAGDHAAATLVYREFRHLLQREVNAAPGPEITALFERYRVASRGGAASNGVGRSGFGVRGSDRTPNAERPTPVPPVLPHPISSFIGREQEAEEIQAALAGARLVTLTGPGGVGKTRLALHVGAQLLPDYPDGAWFVDLAPLSSPSLVLPTVANALGLNEQPERSLLQALQQFLSPRRALLILDNCEHLLDACAGLVAELLQACPHLRMLATSRQSLGITGETDWQVPPLSLPPVVDGEWSMVNGPTGTDSDRWRRAISHQPSAISQFAAIRLFVERGRAADRSFSLTEENAGAVVAICRHLDGLPLAIELAAARLKGLSAPQIVDRLAGALRARFSLLTGGSRTALPRHQTLRAAIDWSYELLTEPERALYRSLAVFAGSFTLDAVEAVCGDLGLESDPSAIQHYQSQLPNPAVLDLLTELVDRSLVVAEEVGVGGSDAQIPNPQSAHAACGYPTPNAEKRFRLLETLREYALEQWSEQERVELGRRHARHYLAFAEETPPWLSGDRQTPRLDRLEREHDNLRAAFDWAVAHGDMEVGLRLGPVLGWFWSARGYATEGRARLAALLERAAAGPVPRHLWGAQAHALGCAGSMAAAQQDDASARTLYEQSLALHREVGDRVAEAYTLISLGNIARRSEAFAAARSLLTEGLTLLRKRDDPGGVALALCLLGELAENQGHAAVAEAHYQESLELWREQEDRGGMLLALQSLGRLAYLRGSFGLAKCLATKSLALARELKHKQGTAMSLYLLGSIARLERQYATAAAYHSEDLAVYQELGDLISAAGSMGTLAYALHFQGQHHQAEKLFQESLVINRKLNNRRQTALCLEGLAGVAAHATPRPGEARTARLQRSARLFGAAATLREGRAPRWPADQADYERNLAVLQAALDADTLARFWAEGRAMTLDEATALALEAADDVMM